MTAIRSGGGHGFLLRFEHILVGFAELPDPSFHGVFDLPRSQFSNEDLDILARKYTDNHGVGASEYGHGQQAAVFCATFTHLHSSLVRHPVFFGGNL